MREERLVTSLLAKRCKVRGPMRASGVAATFWAERQVRAGGRSNEEVDLPAARGKKKKKTRERQTELISLSSLLLRLPDFSRRRMINSSSANISHELNYRYF